MLAQGYAEKVGKRVVDPHQQEREENDGRLPVSAAHIGKINQQGEGKGYVKQCVNAESQVLECVRIFPVQLADAEQESRQECQQIAFSSAGEIVQKAGTEKQAAAEEAQRSVDADADESCYVCKFKYPDEVDDKKKNIETKRIKEYARR